MLVTTLVMVALVVVAGCSSGTSGDDTSAGATRVVTTAEGTVNVPVDAKRIVVLNYALAGYLFNLDLPVIAVTTQNTDHDSEYDEAWREKATANKTSILKWSADGFSIESILALKPDLIIGGGWGLPSKVAADQYKQLSAVAPTVIVDKSLKTWQDQFSFLAQKVFDRDAAYQGLLTKYRDRVAEVKASITPPPGPATYISIAAGNKAFVLFESSALPAELTSVGIQPAPVQSTHNLQPYSPGQDSASVSDELLGDIVTSPTVFVTGFNATTTSVAELKAKPAYAGLPAFRSGHAYDLPNWAYRGDYDDAMALLDLIAKQFPK